MKRFLSIFSLLLAAAGTCVAGSIDEILKQIEKNNIDLQSLKHEQEAIVQDIKAENVLAGPSVEYSPFYQRGNHGTAESELIVSQEIEFPTKYLARNRQAKLQQTVNGYAYQNQRRETLLQAKLLCIDVICINQRLQMLQQRLQSNEALLTIFEKRMEAGDANILELNKVKLDYMEVKSLMAEAENERTTLLGDLEQLNGGNPVDISDTEFPELKTDIDYSTFVQLAMQNDAAIQKAEAEVSATQHEVNSNRREWLPNLSVGYRRNTELRDNVNGFLVGFSFPILNTGNKVKAAKERQQSAELALQQNRLAVEAAYKGWYDELQSLLRVMDHSDVAMMRETLELLSKALQHGEISALQYYTEANSIYEKLQGHIEVHCQCVKLCSELYKSQL